MGTPLDVVRLATLSVSLSLFQVRSGGVAVRNAVL